MLWPHSFCLCGIAEREKLYSSQGGGRNESSSQFVPRKRERSRNLVIRYWSFFDFERIWTVPFWSIPKERKVCCSTYHIWNLLCTLKLLALLYRHITQTDVEHVSSFSLFVHYLFVNLLVGKYISEANEIREQPREGKHLNEQTSSAFRVCLDFQAWTVIIKECLSALK